LYASQLVISEASRGDSEAAQKRLNALKGIELLKTDNEAEKLARKFLNQ